MSPVNISTVATFTIRAAKVPRSMDMEKAALSRKKAIGLSTTRQPNNS